jgi:glucose-1-phosphate thymidylyltransferase
VAKGIVLAGGTGTRLYPSTKTACKQLLPVYDKPLVYYPLNTLMQFGIRRILVISTPEDLPRFEALLGDGRELGLELSYSVQPRPEGIAQAFLLGEEFIGGDPVALILGDNIFYGIEDYVPLLRDFSEGGVIFAHQVKKPQRYGVVELDADGSPVGIEEKPSQPRSTYAVTGLYFYDAGVVEIARELHPSARGELEITDINNAYLSRGKLRVVPLGQGVAWLDTGMSEAMLDAANFIAAIEKRQRQKIACIEETAFRAGFIDRGRLQRLVTAMPQNDYRAYLEEILREAERGF